MNHYLYGGRWPLDAQDKLESLAGEQVTVRGARGVRSENLKETKIVDANGVIRKMGWRLGDLSSSTTIFDERRREVEIHALAKKGVSSPRDVNDRTLFSYDENGVTIEAGTNSLQR